MSCWPFYFGYSIHWRDFFISTDKFIFFSSFYNFFFVRLESLPLLGGDKHLTASLGLFLNGICIFYWRRKWQPTPVFLPGESQGQRSLVGCHLWGRTESTGLKRLNSSTFSILSSSRCYFGWETRLIFFFFKQASCLLWLHVWSVLVWLNWPVSSAALERSGIPLVPGVCCGLGWWV